MRQRPSTVIGRTETARFRNNFRIWGRIPVAMAVRFADADTTTVLRMAAFDCLLANPYIYISC